MAKKIILTLFALIALLLIGYATLVKLPPGTMSQAEKDYIISTYQFKNGQKLQDLKIHYTTLGTAIKNERGEITNAVLLLHWTGADGTVFLTEDFKANLYAAGKPLDLSKFFLIIPDNIGHGKSSKPSDGLQSDFPNYGYLDMVDLQHELVVSELRISHLKMVIGASMGGMHCWLWSELYPNFMDGVMPIVCLPQKITGRNLIWRDAIVDAIKNDPIWNQGKYIQQPYSLKSTWPFARMLLDGVPHLASTVQDRSEGVSFVQNAALDASKKDANDLIYVLSASKDYDPEPHLDGIQTKVFALNFTDDQLNPVELGVLPELIKRVKHGKAVIQEGNAHTFGHLTMTHPELWAHQVSAFIEFLHAPAN